MPLEQRFTAGLGLLKELTKSARVCLIDLSNKEEPRIQQNVGIDAPRMDPHIIRAATRITAENSARSDQFRQQQKRFALITVPLISKGKIDSCLSVIKEMSIPVDLDALMTTIQLFAVHFYGMESEKERQRESRASLRIAGFAEAMDKAASADDFPECAAQLAESFRDLAECDRVALATIRFGAVRIQAISGVPSSETMRSEAATAIETLMKTAVRENRIIELDNQANSLQMPETGNLGAGKILCAPLIHREKATGAWLFLWKQPPLDLDERVRFLRTATGLIGPQLPILQRTKPGKFGGILLRLWKRATKNQRMILCLAALFGGGMVFAPVSMPVKAACTLQPEVRRTVSAPFDGILRRALVDPGERVTVGQPLAELDGREVDWNLADTGARILGAEKQADRALSAGQIADSQIAILEAESLSETMKVLNYRKENLLIKSPISGLILEGDLKRDVGATMRMGESLFEVGSLNTMVAEIEVHESDIALIRPSARVRLRFDAKPGEALETEIISVSPKSEFRNGANVFICRVILDNEEGWLWPGGVGRARIEGPRRPAIWCLLRTPTNWILQHLP